MTTATVASDHILTAIRETIDYPSYTELRQQLAQVYCRHYWGGSESDWPADAIRACLWSTAEISGDAVASLLDSAMQE